jgi:hypothetical protein
MYRSSNTSKKTRRKEELKKAKEGQSTSSAKKAKTQHQALRLPAATPQISLSGLHGNVVPSMTTVGQNDSVLALPFSSNVHASVTSPLTSSQLAPFAAPYAGTEADSLREMSLLQLRRLEPQGLGDGSSHHFLSLDLQLQTLQRLNHGDQSGQTIPYPPRWFRVASDGSMQMPPLGSVSSSNNPLSTMIENNELLQDLLASSAVETRRPSSLYRNQTTYVTPIGLAATADNFGAFRYPADDDPFEPVPLAEDISLRHAQSRQERKENTSVSFDEYRIRERADFIN